MTDLVMGIDFLVVEFGVLILYLICFYFAYKIKKLDFLIYASVFAFLFESLHVFQFSESVSGYVYSGGFFIYLFSVPLFVVLAWGILLLGAHIVSLKLHMSKVSRIFFVTFFVTFVDFVIEGVSVNLGYWTWLGAVGGGNLFSHIVADNFIGWLGVSFGFILCYEYLEKKWLSMFLGIFGLFFLGLVLETLSWFFGGERYLSLAVIVLGFIVAWIYFYHNNKILKKNKKDFRVNFFYARWIFFMRIFFYLFGFYFFIRDGHYLDLIYDFVLFGVLLVEVYFFLRFRGILKKRV